MMRSEKGVSAVEFALVAPLLFVLTFGIIEFGLLLFDKAVLTNAVREGTRAAIVYRTNDGDNFVPLDDALICQVVKNYANPLLINLGGTGDDDLDDGHITIDYNADPPQSGDDVTVTAVYTFDFLVFPDLSALIGGSFNGTIELTATTVMRIE